MHTGRNCGTQDVQEKRGTSESTEEHQRGTEGEIITELGRREEEKDDEIKEVS